MPKPARTRPVSAAQVRAYAGKAQEYVDAAANEIDAERFIAATSLAIHAAINAADAVCGARLGERAAGEAHDQVLALLRTAGKDGLAVERELRRLLRRRCRPPARVAEGASVDRARTRAPRERLAGGPSPR